MSLQPKTNAQRQAAYRSRRRSAIDEMLCMRGLPPLPALATIPGWPRWKEAMARVIAQLQAIDTEMNDYHQERSERWQQSEQAEAFNERLEALRLIVEDAQQWPE